MRLSLDVSLRNWAFVPIIFATFLVRLLQVYGNRALGGTAASTLPPPPNGVGLGDDPTERLARAQATYRAQLLCRPGGMSILPATSRAARVAHMCGTAPLEHDERALVTAVGGGDSLPEATGRNVGPPATTSSTSSSGGIVAASNDGSSSSRSRSHSHNKLYGVLGRRASAALAAKSQASDAGIPSLAGLPVQDPSQMLPEIFKMIFMYVPNLALYLWVSHFFQGTVVARVPLGLNERFRAMLQQGLDITNLDVSYVSSFSFYILTMSGLGGILELLLQREFSSAELSPVGGGLGNQMGAVTNPLAMLMGESGVEKEMMKLRRETLGYEAQWALGGVKGVAETTRMLRDASRMK